MFQDLSLLFFCADGGVAGQARTRQQGALPCVGADASTLGGRPCGVCRPRLLPFLTGGSLAAARASAGRVRGCGRGAAAQAAGLAVNGVAARGCGMWEVLHGSAQGPVCRVPVEAGALVGAGRAAAAAEVCQSRSYWDCCGCNIRTAPAVGQARSVGLLACRPAKSRETQRYGCGMGKFADSSCSRAHARRGGDRLHLLQISSCLQEILYRVLACLSRPVVVLNVA